jgi:hypothetical protein
VQSTRRAFAATFAGAALIDSADELGHKKSRAPCGTRHFSMAEWTGLSSDVLSLALRAPLATKIAPGDFVKPQSARNP